jgi:indolepyruvate ferredoxin oxidoreductase beta subunit
MPVITGAMAYPENLIEKMRAAGAKVDALDCLSLAREAGSVKAVNIVLMGRLSHCFDLPEEAWLAALETVVPAKFLDLNKKAFALGRNA